MTPQQVKDARKSLNLSCEELGRELRLQGRYPGDTIRRWERGDPNISGPASLALEALLSGWRPK